MLTDWNHVTLWLRQLYVPRRGLRRACAWKTFKVNIVAFSPADCPLRSRRPNQIIHNPHGYTRGNLAITPGTRIGVYEILGSLGAGGMGEVYRARDTKLGRDVALKVLPPAFTADADRVARFEREARLLASLNHPHIGAIYGFEDAGEVPALVLELVEGETLDDRLAGVRCLSRRRWPSPNKSPTRSMPRTGPGSSIAISNPPTSRSRPMASSRCSISVWRKRTRVRGPRRICRSRRR